MKMYIATTAHGFSSERAVCVARKKELAERGLAEVYPNLKKDRHGDYIPCTNDVQDQAYVREYEVIGAAPKKPASSIDYDESGNIEASLVTTAFVTSNGPAYESPWGVAVCREDAVREIERSFEGVWKLNENTYLTRIELYDGTVSTVVIRIRKEIVAV